MHIPGSTTVDPNELKLITSYVVPPRGGANCVGAFLWGDEYAEYSIYKNGVYQCGGRTSAASPTLQLDCTSCPIDLNGNDVLIVMGEHGGSVPRDLKAVLLINLL